MDIPLSLRTMTDRAAAPIVVALVVSLALAGCLATVRDGGSTEIQRTGEDGRDADPGGSNGTAGAHRAGNATIRPGFEIGLRSSDSGPRDAGCTLGFLFESVDNDTVYGSTAGHCAEDGNHVVTDRNGRNLGRIVAFRNVAAEDWALIRFRPEVRDETGPTVQTWTGPTGTLDPDDIEDDDVLCYHGTGPPDDLHDRCGRFSLFYRYRQDGYAVDHFKMRGEIGWAGDSGSAVVHHGTGQAIGMITGGDYNPVYSSLRGPTVCGIVNGAADAGWNVTLMTAPYDPSSHRPIVPYVTAADRMIARTNPAYGACGPS